MSQPVKILTDEERNETFYYIHGQEVDPADYAPPAAMCITCRKERLPQFKTCHNCDPDGFYDEACCMSNYDVFEWLYELFGGETHIYPDRGALCIEFSGNGRQKEQAEILLDTLRIHYSKYQGLDNETLQVSDKKGGIEITLMPGWNGRYELKK